MPDTSGSVKRWRVLGRFLPREVRDRIFEPAFSDLLYAWLSERDGSRGVPFGLRAVGTYMGCFPSAFPRLFVRAGRLTRLGRLVVWSAAAVSLLVLFLLNVAQSYVDYGN